MSTNNDTELPQASPESTIEDKLKDHIAKRVAVWFGEPVLAVEEEIQAIITTETTKKEHEARMNLLEYFDQIPKNEHMDWKGLIADCKRLLKEEQE